MTGETKQTNPQIAAMEYLHYYCDQGNQFDYAVMLRGRWGAGKTFFINQFIKERKSHGSEKNLYVSLYGLSSFHQIDEALYHQLHPVLSSKGMKLITKISKGLLRASTSIDIDGGGKDHLTLSSNIPDVDFLEYFKTPKECLLIFDDLERCSMKISDVLGYINSFVEHEGFKAIIIANEEEILAHSDERYTDIKEKLVGQTLTIRSSVADALPNFITQIKDEKTKAYLSKQLKDIQLIHSQSDTDNLRLLKHALWDFERLGLCFTDAHWTNDEAVGILFRNVLALSFEVRGGRLSEEQLLAVPVNSRFRLFKKKSDEPSTQDQLKTRYPEIEFEQ